MKMASFSGNQDATLQNICDELGGISEKWYKIGIQLGIPRNVLQQFKSDDDPLSAVIDWWLVGNAGGDISWNSIVNILKSKHIGESGLASKLRKKYCNGADSISDSSTASQQSPNSSPDEMTHDQICRLERNLQKIIDKYGLYVDCLRELINKRVPVKDLQAFLLTISAFSTSNKGEFLTLMSDRKQELEATDTVNEVITFLVTEYSSFLNYDIFEKIRKRYKIYDHHEELKYPEHLKKYIEDHEISEFFKINPLLEDIEKRYKDCKELIIKLDIENTCRLAKIVDLRKFISNIFDLDPSALHIVDVKEGCLTVKFLIPTFLVDSLFTPFTKLSSEQEDKLRSQSVLWLQCNCQTFFISNVSDSSDNGFSSSSSENLVDIHDEKKELEKQMLAIEEALTQSDIRHHEISKERNAIQADIDSRVSLLHQTLDNRKAKLVGKLNQFTQAKQSTLAAQRGQLLATKAKLQRCMETFNPVPPVKSLPIDHSTTIKAEVLMGPTTKAECRILADITNGCQKYRRVSKRARSPDSSENCVKVKKAAVGEMPKAVTKILNSNSQPCTKPNAKAGDITKESQKYGQMSRKVDPFKCCATGEGMEKAAVGETSKAVLSILNSDGQPCLADSISCELVSAIASSKVTRGSVVRIGQSKYEISYQPSIKGRHQLHLKVEGEHIKGSPFPVTARLPVKSLGTPILTISGVEGPVGVAVNQGEVMVTEWGKECITVFTSSGKRLQSFGTCGLRHGQFSEVAVDSNHNCILVADYANHRILKFTSDGEFSRAIGTYGSGPLQFDFPVGIAISARNGRVYIGGWNGRIQILNSDLSYFGAFGTKGSGKGQFSDPCQMACDSVGNVYVADKDNHRIQVFTADGEFLRMFGVPGGGRGELSEPHGVAIDSSDRVYVSEWGNHRISVFTSEGEFVTAFGRKGKGPGQFEYPSGLAVDDCGVVYVCDENRIQLF